MQIPDKRGTGVGVGGGGVEFTPQESKWVKQNNLVCYTSEMA